jgi:hypothetical protein
VHKRFQRSKHLKRHFYGIFVEKKITFHREHITESYVLEIDQKYFRKILKLMTTAVVINNFQRKYYENSN